VILISSRATQFEFDAESLGKEEGTQMSDYRMSGSELYDADHQLVAKAKGESLFDHDNRRVGFIRGNTLFDLEERKMMSVRGSDILDASDKRVASLGVVTKRIQGAAAELMCIAMWYCFVR
jgi:hypothetical protein